ncbi:MAG TPA: thioredoxin domain-containing protein [Acidobacteriaceae bacterium]|nr:thioredoxin domain-containing protein [Acidobacteriaceae bacterium]
MAESTSTAVQTRNTLDQASSSYLRSAMHQPVYWQEWSEGAFALAAQLDKPVLLDVGAVWCHWCHVMDRESYEDPTLAQTINEHFVAIKVDRDERPDVDARYQAAAQAIAGQGGWPLTAILTPDGRPFFAGTYFPREDRYGRPGFERVLLTLANAWKTQRSEVLESAASVIAAIEHGETFSARSDTLSFEIVDKLVASAVGQFDPRHGGFGSQPKFPHPGILDLLIDVAARTGNEAAREAATMTLKKMARGGVYDQLAGGFHRYSVDERWVVPHFEKMLYDNAGLLANYAHAFQTFVEPEFAATARDILRWMNEWLSDQESGGFYASQDADISLDDDGDYFTWTREEAAAVLALEEMSAAELYYDIGDVGDMHHNPKKNVLHRNFAAEEIARKLGRDAASVERDLGSAKQKLYAARLLRPTPFVDKTLYTGWNAMAISAYLDAARILDLEAPRVFALRTMDRILREGWSPTAGLAHVIAYPDQPGTAKWIAGVLDDYALLAHACVDAWESTGVLRYYKFAMQIADSMVERFHDREGGGFFDTDRVAADKIGALAARRKPMQDSPTPAGNATAAGVLLRLHALSGRDDFRSIAQDTLAAFAGVIEHYGLYAGSYGLALERLLLPSIQAVIAGQGPAARQLAAIANARYAVNKAVILLSPDQVAAANLPPLLAETLPHLPGLDQASDKPVAMVCRGTACLPPAASPDTLIEQINAAL